MAEPTIPVIPERHPAQRLSLIVHNARPLSIASSASYSPNINPATSSATQSLIIETAHRYSRQRSIEDGDLTLARSPGSERDQMDGQETNRYGFASGPSGRYGSTGAIKAQPSQRSREHAALSPSKRRISAPTAVGDSLGFPEQTPAIDTTYFAKTHHQSRSNVTTADSIVSDATRTDYHTVLHEVDGMTEPTEGWPLPTPPGSPKSKDEIQELPSHANPSTNTSRKAVVLLEKQMDPHLTTPSPRTPKFTRVPFLARLFNKSATRDESSSSMMAYHLDEKGPPPPPKPFFEDESDNDAESIHIVQATRARVGTPMLVKHGSTGKVRLKDMLRSTSPINSRPNMGPTKVKAANILGEDSSYIDDIHREETFGRPEAIYSNDAVQDATSYRSGATGHELWKDINPFAPTSITRSQPLQVPIQHDPKDSSSVRPIARKVSFPLPNPLDIRPEHRFLRQSIVSTPYPSGDSKESNKKQWGLGWKGSPNVVTQKKIEGEGSVLTLVLYRQSNPYPLIRTVAVPGKDEAMLVQDRTDEFDDEKLFKRIKSEYAGMRGSLHQLSSARSVQSINLLSYSSTSQLVLKKARAMQFHGDDTQEEIAEARMLNLLHKPRLGRNHYEWTQWVKTLPQNSKDDQKDKSKIALELVEGWSPGRLYLSVATVLVLSLLATLLWIFLGTDESSKELVSMATDSYVKDGTASHPAGSYAGIAAHATSFHGAGERVGPGAALGILVLFLGWTGVGAWMLLNWLVM